MRGTIDLDDTVCGAQGSSLHEAINAASAQAVSDIGGKDGKVRVLRPH